METKNYTYEKVPFNEKRPSFYENDTYQSTTKSANSSNKTFLFIVAIIGNLISFSVGAAISWTSPELEKIDKVLKITKEQGSWISSILHLGAACGPYLFGYLADKIGRKPTIILMGLPLAVAFLLLAFIQNFYVICFARLLCGFATGGLFTVMPIYVGEIADSHNRGILAGLLNLFVCLGVLFSYCVGPYVDILAFNLILLVFPIISIPLFYFVACESPRYMMSKDKYKQAKAILHKIRVNKDNIDDEINAIEKSLKEEGDGRIKDVFTSSGNRKAFVIVMGLLIFQQFSGINAIFSYSEKIFAQAGTSISPAVCAIILGVVQVFSSFVSSALIDRLGRKILLLASGVGMVLSEVPLGIYSYLKDQMGKDVSSVSLLPVICLLVYIVTYNVGSGALPWTVMGEMFPTNVKSKASSMCASFCWMLAFLIVRYFTTVEGAFGLGACFLTFGGFCLLFVVFTYFYVFETKGKTLEEIQDVLNK